MSVTRQKIYLFALSLQTFCSFAYEQAKIIFICLSNIFSLPMNTGRGNFGHLPMKGKINVQEAVNYMVQLKIKIPVTGECLVELAQTQKIIKEI